MRPFRVFLAHRFAALFCRHRGRWSRVVKRAIHLGVVCCRTAGARLLVAIRHVFCALHPVEGRSTTTLRGIVEGSIFLGIGKAISVTAHSGGLIAPHVGRASASPVVVQRAAFALGRLDRLRKVVAVKGLNSINVWSTPLSHDAGTAIVLKVVNNYGMITARQLNGCLFCVFVTVKPIIVDEHLPVYP